MEMCSGHDFYVNNSSNHQWLQYDHCYICDSSLSIDNVITFNEFVSSLFIQCEHFTHLKESLWISQDHFIQAYIVLEILLLVTIDDDYVAMQSEKSS